MKIIAHRSDKTEKEQLLEEHLYNTAELAKKEGESINLGWTSYILGLVHDIGKADIKFQNYIRGAGGRVIHSSAGGKYISNLIEDIFDIGDEDVRLYKTILEYVVYSHHGLFNCFNEDFESNIELRKNYDNDTSYDYNYVENYINEILRKNNISIKEVLEKSYCECITIINKLKKMCNYHKKKSGKDIEFNYYIHCFVRLLLSILKEADVTDSVKFEYDIDDESDVDKNDFSNFVEKIENVCKIFKENEKTEIHMQRNILSEQIKENAKVCDAGIYKLNAPTGAGKTILSLRFALNNAVNFSKKKIFYVAPYLSILEQNSKAFKEILGEDTVLEYHSNVERNGKDNFNNEEENIFENYLEEKWDKSFITTTCVQFFNSLMKGKSVNIRRFEKFKNSIVILDEVQSLPDKMTYNFMLFLKFMKEIMNTTFVLCTATQPIYNNESLDYKIEYGSKENDIIDLINLSELTKSVFKRVNFKIIGEESVTSLAEKLLEKLDKKNSILVVVNTKSKVRELHNELVEKFSNVEIYELTTFMCAQHRIDTIANIKENLRENKKVIVVSTQLIEAGVDLDFEVVYRSLAGFDNFIQAAGRCNREGKKKSGEAYFFEFKENIQMLDEIKRKKTTTAEVFKVLEKYEDIDIDEITEKYFKKHYESKTTRNIFKYILDEGTLLDILSTNKKLKSRVKYADSKLYSIIQSSSLVQNFKEASNKFELIDKMGDDELQGIVVYYNNKHLIEELEKSWENKDFSSYKKIKRKLQRYTINLFYEKDKKNLLKLIGDIYILRELY